MKVCIMGQLPPHLAISSRLSPSESTSFGANLPGTVGNEHGCLPCQHLKLGSSVLQGIRMHGVSTPILTLTLEAVLK